MFLGRVLREGNPEYLQRYWEDAGEKTKRGLSGYSNFNYHPNKKSGFEVFSSWFATSGSFTTVQVCNFDVC